MKDLLTTALKYHAAGLRVVPVKDDKRPAVSSWKQYQVAQTENDVRFMFSTPQYGIAVLTGINGLEVVDVDSKYDLTGTLITDLQAANDQINDPEGKFINLTVCRTRSGGWHLMYYCDQPEGNKKLAERPPAENEDQKTTPVLLETRGIGGYVVVAPTPGYEVDLGSLTNIPRIKQTTRDNLIRVCRSFNQNIKPDPATEYKARPKEQINTATDGVTPWQDYNERNDPVDVLMRNGWSVVFETKDRIHMKRPGTTDAKTSGNYHNGKGVFVSHTTSTALPTEVGLNAFSIYTHLEHGGDFKAAGRALSAQGYGSKPTGTTPAAQKAAPTPEQVQEQENALIAFVRSTRFDVHAPITEEAATLTVRPPGGDGKVYKVGGRSMIGAIVGEQKSGKSFLFQNIIASGLNEGFESCYFSYKTGATDRLIFFDTEQSEYFYKRSQARIYQLAGLRTNSMRYEAYHLRRLPVKERIKAIDFFINDGPPPALIGIDGLVDLCSDFNNERDSSETMEHLMRWSDETGALLLTVLHLTKGAGFMRGHLGTALQNKCDFSIEVTQNQDQGPGWFGVKSRDSRFTPFPKFEFLRDPQTGLLAGQPVSNSFPASAFAPDLSGLAPASAMAQHAPGADELIPF